MLVKLTICKDRDINQPCNGFIKNSVGFYARNGLEKSLRNKLLLIELA